MVFFHPFILSLIHSLVVTDSDEHTGGKKFGDETIMYMKKADIERDKNENE